MMCNTARRLTVLSAAVASAALFSSVASAASPVTGWVIFDPPGSVQGTSPAALNNLGAVVGTYYDVNNNQHGFVRNPDGSYVTIDVPGSGNQTAVSDINDAGTMTGYYEDASGNYHGWVLPAGGTFAIFDPPASAGQTFANAINSSGEIVGNYYDVAGNDHGFIRSIDGTLTVIDDPNPPNGATTVATRCAEINDNGEIGCKTLDSTSTFHYSLRTADGTWTFIDVPGAGIGRNNGTYGPLAHGLSNSGELAGSYSDNRGGTHGYVRSSSGVISEFDARLDGAATGNGSGTYSSSLNPSGTIIGLMQNLDANFGRGYVRYRDGRVVEFQPPGAPPTGSYLEPWCMNKTGEFTGNYIDAQGNYHGFIAQLTTD